MFIEGAYKLLLFAKVQKKYACEAIKVFNQEKLMPESYFDYKAAFGRVMKSWYERRIDEETEKNKKLRELHDNLL